MEGHWYGNDQNGLHLMEFIAEKAENMEKRETTNQLSKAYKQARNMNGTIKSYKEKLDMFSPIIHLMTEFGTSTKVRMMFVMGSSVNPAYLEKLRERANVDVDYRSRIKKYESFDGSLKLSIPQPIRKSSRISFTVAATNRDQEMLQLLAEMSRDATLPLPERDFIEKFSTITRDRDPYPRLVARYAAVKESICKSNIHSNKEKARMAFASNASVYGQFLKDLRKDATVLVDDHGKIMEYKSNDGSLHLVNEELRGLHQPINPPIVRTPQPQQVTLKAEPQNEAPAAAAPEQGLYLIPDEVEAAVAPAAPPIVRTPQPQQVTLKAEPQIETPAVAAPEQALYLIPDEAAAAGAPLALKAAPVHRLALVKVEPPAEQVAVAREFQDNYQTFIAHFAAGCGQSKETLKWLNYLILQFPSPALAELKERVERAIEQSGQMPRHVTIDSIVTALGPIVLVMSKTATAERPTPEGNVSISVFARHLVSAFQCFPYSSTAYNFRLSVERISQDYGELSFPLGSIRSVLETVFVLAS